MENQVIGNKNQTTQEKIYNALLRGEEAQRTFAKAYIDRLCYDHSDLQPADIVNFLHKAQLSGADPARDQIYLVKHNKKVNGRFIKVGTPIFSYHFMLAKANLTGELCTPQVSTQKEDVFNPWTCEDNSMLVSTCKIERLGKGFTIFKARWSEYVKNTAIWKDKPYPMLEKCALVGALRRAFPEACSNMYIEEEMKFEEKSIEAEVVNPTARVKERMKVIDEIKTLANRLCIGLVIKDKMEFIDKHGLGEPGVDMLSMGELQGKLTTLRALQLEKEG